MRTNIYTNVAAIRVEEYTRAVVLTYIKDICNINIQKDIPNASEYFDETTEQLLRDGIFNSSGVTVATPIDEKQTIPTLYRFAGIATMTSCILGFVFMVFDLRFSLTNVGPVAYIIFCFCCLSLYFTNKFALKEWKILHGSQELNEQIKNKTN